MNFIIGQPKIFGITIINVNSFFVVARLDCSASCPFVTNAKLNKNSGFEMRDVVRLVVTRMRLSAPLSSSPVFRLFVEFSIWPFPGANQKSSSHFHCLKCDYYCTDTNKVSRHIDRVHMDPKRYMELHHKGWALLCYCRWWHTGGSTRNLTASWQQVCC